MSVVTGVSKLSFQTLARSQELEASRQLPAKPCQTIDSLRILTSEIDRTYWLTRMVTMATDVSCVPFPNGRAGTLFPYLKKKLMYVALYSQVTKWSIVEFLDLIRNSVRFLVLACDIFFSYMLIDPNVSKFFLVYAEIWIVLPAVM